MKSTFVFIHYHLCLGVSRVSVHIVACQCVSVVSLPLFLHLLLPLTADYTGNTPPPLPPLPLTSPFSALLSLLVVPCALEQKLPSEWLDITFLTSSLFFFFFFLTSFGIFFSFFEGGGVIYFKTFEVLFCPGSVLVWHFGTCSSFFWVSAWIQVTSKIKKSTIQLPKQHICTRTAL